MLTKSRVWVSKLEGMLFCATVAIWLFGSPPCTQHRIAAIQNLTGNSTKRTIKLSSNSGSMLCAAMVDFNAMDLHTTSDRRRSTTQQTMQHNPNSGTLFFWKWRSVSKKTLLVTEDCQCQPCCTSHQILTFSSFSGQNWILWTSSTYHISSGSFFLGKKSVR